MLNEARFGLRYQSTGRFIATESSDSTIQAAAKEWFLNGGSNSNGTVYPAAFIPAGVGNGFVNYITKGLRARVRATRLLCTTMRIPSAGAMAGTR